MQALAEQDDGTIDAPSDEEVGAEDDDSDDSDAEVHTAVQDMVDKAQRQAAVSVRTGTHNFVS